MNKDPRDKPTAGYYSFNLMYLMEWVSWRFHPLTRHWPDERSIAGSIEDPPQVNVCGLAREGAITFNINGD
jgi:hypothetical protein